MPINKKTARLVAGYVKPGVQARMKRIRKAKPRYNLSYQIEQALEAYLPVLEAHVGFKPKPSNQLMP